MAVLIRARFCAKFCGSCADEFGEAGVGDVADTETQHEPIPERFEFTALRHLVARAEERDQRNWHFLVAVMENPLIGDLQQRVQDCALALKTSSRKTSSASTNLPMVMRLYSSRLRPLTDTGPKSSSGVVKRVIR